MFFSLSLKLFEFLLLSESELKLFVFPPFFYKLLIDLLRNN